VSPTPEREELEQTAQLLRDWTDTIRSLIDHQRQLDQRLVVLAEVVAELRTHVEARDQKDAVVVGLLESIRDHLVKIRLAGE
jgi:hypothetical protein